MCFATLCSKSLQVTSRERTEDFGEKESLDGKCQLLLYHDEGWKQMVQGDFSLCCGAVVHCSGVFESQEQDRMKKEPRLRSMLVRRLRVVDSPHREMSESGGVRQHPLVERIAREGHVRSCDVQPLCKQWWRGACKDDGTCSRRHFFLDEAEQGKYDALKNKSESMRTIESLINADDPFLHADKASRSKSDALFVDWLVGTFGEEELRRGVVDVAGGKGELSFFLLHRHGVGSCIVDPRPVRLTKSEMGANCVRLI
ncbi:hypothetical protein GUITHDRAFT_105020 [Guillardia theta CCMP2712]|uniref:C3H1-type domain-containing protein n=1 Tax=Guillardia theta (strain CCMP2712) TaxID=905079 RepID=L1JMS1_GUITC|nr:hypothetical protein GUITHDRAFT_105020 [Guillardia theta CCMP2712]EKX49495.1 hypothetical protein GUITHDRAFT_105020 [Guillardia theta CCMP2712]|eukprot:XP_005836475.1 hypothetical protein GUITHDRAFT_105020 [Guillardia theta CCMP2712]